MGEQEGNGTGDEGRVMKSIRRIRQMYKASRLIGITQKIIVLTAGKYHLVRHYDIDRYGRGKGFYYYVARNYGRRHKLEIVAMGDRSFGGCVNLMMQISFVGRVEAGGA